MRAQKTRSPRSTSRSRRSTTEFHELLAGIPNVPHESVPVGKARRGQRRSAPRGRAPRVRFRAQSPLGSRPRTRHPRFRARRQDHRRALCRLLGPGREARARADQFHARRAHARARLHRSAAAVPGEFGQPLRHRPAAQVRRRSLQVRRPRFLADSHRRSAGHQHLSRRNAGRRRAAHQPLRLHAVLPQRGRLLWARRARHHPPAPVPEGGDW